MSSDPCAIWESLLNTEDEYRGEIYDSLVRNRTKHTQHLIGCPICREKIEPLLAWIAVRPEELPELDDRNLAIAVRELGDITRNKIPKKYTVDD